MLFFMCSRRLPFEDFRICDNVQRYLGDRPELFWMYHSEKQQMIGEAYSEEFKHLLTCMLQPNPEQRLCIADVFFHPWMTSGEVATAEEVKTELEWRQHVVRRVKSESSATR